MVGTGRWVGVTTGFAGAGVVVPLGRAGVLGVSLLGAEPLETALVAGALLEALVGAAALVDMTVVATVAEVPLLLDAQPASVPMAPRLSTTPTTERLIAVVSDR